MTGDVFLGYVIDGITNKIHEQFPDVDIYADYDVEQGLSEPSFYIQLLESESMDLIRGHGMMTFSFVIHYFPENKRNRAHMYSVGQKLHDVLRYISVDKRLQRADDGVSFHIIDGVLQYHIKYTHYIDGIEVGPVMRTLKNSANGCICKDMQGVLGDNDNDNDNDNENDNVNDNVNDIYEVTDG